MRARLRLLRSHRVGIQTYKRLMAEHSGDAQAALAALPQLARSAGVKEYTACPPGLVDRELAAARRVGARMLWQGDPLYPSALLDLPDAPPMLWARGVRDLLDRPAVALVGARNASSLGRRMAASLAKGLGDNGLVVASGLARGIDKIVHETALSTGTIAVVAGGVDVIYPRENAALTGLIAEQGLILSEMPMGVQPQARHFPRRNRIISGLSRAVVVVEAAVRSGSLITARDALDQGREVMAVPGHPFDARAAGCNLLLRDGAALVRGPDDVLEVLASLPQPSIRNVVDRTPAPSPPRLLRESAPDRSNVGDPVRDRILTFLGPSPIAEDQLVRDLALPGQAIAEELLALEMDGAVIRQPGGLLARSA
ncbi:DNA-processing protein DprA [Aliiruegeria haliotis]|uniref:DNA-processing protein DprA n=1 Tax=Aliiruegeria haliotis TaxID=1280846 RepID=UPI0031838DA4